MNEEDYGTREACQRLVNARIILKTDWYWAQQTPDDDYVIGDRSSILLAYSWYPTPSMAEVWREIIPYVLGHYEEMRDKVWEALLSATFFNTNPTDALIDLLIWVKKED